MFGKAITITEFDYTRIQNNIHGCTPEVLNRLNEKLKKAKIIDSKKIKPTVITINSRFIVKNLGNGLKKEFSLVLPEDEDEKNNKISVFGRFGAEIFLHEEGEVVRCTNFGEAYYKIESILYQPESAGDFHL